MSHDHNNRAADPAKHAQAPEAELPQAPPGAPEGHDASTPGAQAPQSGPAAQPQPGAEAQPDLAAITAKAEKADEYLALAQRTKADFENYRKRASRDAAAAQERGAAKLALALLPAIDSLDRALAHADDVVAAQAGNGAETLVAGLKHVHTDLISALANVGIE